MHWIHVVSWGHVQSSWKYYREVMRHFENKRFTRWIQGAWSTEMVRRWKGLLHKCCMFCFHDVDMRIIKNNQKLSQKSIVLLLGCRMMYYWNDCVFDCPAGSKCSFANHRSRFAKVQEMCCKASRSYHWSLSPYSMDAVHVVSHK